MRILILSPHTDDGEFGCGGSIAKFTARGDDVFYVAFSHAEKSVPPEFPKDILRAEVREATEILGVRPENLILFNYPVREFPSCRQGILDNIIALKKLINPELVLLPSICDTHQDHQVIAQEGFRAFKEASIIGYEVPRNNMSFPTDVFIALTASQVGLKIRATEKYLSQAHRVQSSPAFIRSLAKVRGTQVGVGFAESFECVRYVIK